MELKKVKEVLEKLEEHLNDDRKTSIGKYELLKGDYSNEKIENIIVGLVDEYMNPKETIKEEQMYTEQEIEQAFLKWNTDERLSPSKFEAEEEMRKIDVAVLSKDNAETLINYIKQ